MRKWHMTAASPGFAKVRGNMLPEEARYASNGCEFHSDCFTCPFADCIKGKARVPAHVDRRNERARTARQLRLRGLKIAEIMARLGASKSSVLRYLRPKA